MDVGPPTSGEGVGGLRHVDPKTQEFRNERSWTEGGTCPARETSVELPARDEGGNSREPRRTEDQKRGRQAKRKRRFRDFILERGRQEKVEKPKERTRRKEKGEGTRAEK